MPAEARISSIWSNQKLLVTVLILAFAGWFVFDGVVGYPRANVRYKAWKSYADLGHTSEWIAYAGERGWKTEEWTSYLHDHHINEPLPDIIMGPDKIQEQLIIATLTALIGLTILGFWFTQKGRVIRSDADAVYSPSGKRIPYAAITGIGKKRWESKGIAVIRYEIEGRKGQFELDDYKFDPVPTHQVLKDIEGKTQLTPPVAAAPAQA